MLARFNSVRVGHGESYLLITVLAAFLGGINPFGGFGRVLPVFVALIVLQLLSSGLNLMALRRRLNGDDGGDRIIDLGFKIQRRVSTDRSGELRRGLTGH